jgi:hypothetical protein
MDRLTTLTELPLLELGDQEAHRAEMDLFERPARHGVREQVARAFHEVDVLLTRRELYGLALRVQPRR